MPTYEYRRTDGSTFEMFQSITAEPLTACPTTNQAVKRVISGGTGFILKGSGFYQTDYGIQSNGTNSSKETKPETETNNKAPANEDAPAAQDSD